MRREVAAAEKRGADRRREEVEQNRFVRVSLSVRTLTNDETRKAALSLVTSALRSSVTSSVRYEQINIL